jgi:hypothetical protein
VTVTGRHFKQMKKPPIRTLCLLSVFFLFVFLASYSQGKKNQGIGYIYKTGKYVIKTGSIRSNPKYLAMTRSLLLLLLSSP